MSQLFILTCAVLLLALQGVLKVEHVNRRLEHLSTKWLDLVDSPGGCIFADCSLDTVKENNR